MEALEARYQATAPDDRLAFHATLAFYDLLTDGERFALERRFPHELAGEPQAAGASEATRVAWDLRSRELVVCMLQFGDRVLAARMDLVRSVAEQADLAVLAMTATGSFLELGKPMPGGVRRYVYRASARPGGRREDGAVKLTEPVVLGNALDVGPLRTTELLIVASGAALPADDDTTPGTMLFGPTEDEPQRAADPVRLAMTRFRVLVDAAGNASPTLAPERLARAASQAREVQQHVAPDGGLALDKVAAVTTGNGSRYEVVVADGTLDLVRHSGDAVQWLYDVNIGEQLVTPGAPLVLFHMGRHRGRSEAKKVAFVFRVVSVEPSAE
ncbi:MAG: hypothetical protein U1F43_11530 [Myxococcota bacterium]